MKVIRFFLCEIIYQNSIKQFVESYENQKHKVFQMLLFKGNVDKMKMQQYHNIRTVAYSKLENHKNRGKIETP